MSDMLTEIDEALRAQQIKALWDKYGQWIIGIVVGAILATAIGVMWHARVTKALEEDTAALITILMNEAEDSQTTEKLAELGKTARDPLKAVVRMYHAQKLEQAGDLQGTQALYNDIIKGGHAADITRDLARVHYVRLGLVIGEDDAADLLRVIDPLTKSRGNFRGSAMELKGILLLKQNKVQEANAMFNTLSNDETVPASIRSRAKTMIAHEAANAK